MEIRLMTEYEIIISFSEEYRTYISEVPELSGFMADGESYQEVVKNAEQVIAEWIETAVELGRYVPKSKGRLFCA
jgi:predicted RNase H-like HicB family nuclease